MRVLLVSTYALGHQPLELASAGAALRAAGHAPRCVDLAVEPWSDEVAAWAEAVAFSVPMHTAMRLAVRAAVGLRRSRPELPVCLFGLYAAVSADTTIGAVADRVIAGEYEPALVAWVDELTAGGTGAGAAPVRIELGRRTALLPARDLLPPLERYTRLAIGHETRVVGSLGATRGCAHRCRHCPVPVVYDGRVRTVDEEAVVADAAQLVALGARHLTYGDPDFLNAPRHAMRTVAAVHAAFPDLTFDCTVKVEHILRHEDLWPTLASAGCLFVVSALESVDDATLRRLDKGHTAADGSRAVALLRREGVELRPSFLPFTPWTTPSDVVALLDFVVDHDLGPNVDPVQYTIRLLLPQGSLLLGHPDVVVPPRRLRRGPAELQLDGGRRSGRPAPSDAGRLGHLGVVGRRDDRDDIWRSAGRDSGHGRCEPSRPGCGGCLARPAAADRALVLLCRTDRDPVRFAAFDLWAGTGSGPYRLY